MQNFAYHAPTTLEEAFSLMGADPEHSRYLAGGTDLYLALEYMPAHQPEPVAHVIDLKRIPGLDGIGGDSAQGMRIGALTLMASIESHPQLSAAYPALAAAAGFVGGPPVRNRATLGGNLVNASPAADTATPLAALDATVVIAGSGGMREIPILELWSAPRLTTLAPGEIVTAVILPPLVADTGNAGNAFARVTRSAMDIALVNAAAALTLDGGGKLASLRVALGAVGPTVVMAPGLEDDLRGQPLNEEALEAVRAAARKAAQPITDVRAGAEYRADMAGVLAARATSQAARMAQGDAP